MKFCPGFEKTPVNIISKQGIRTMRTISEFNYKLNVLLPTMHYIPMRVQGQESQLRTQELGWQE